MWPEGVKARNIVRLNCPPYGLLSGGDAGDDARQAELVVGLAPADDDDRLQADWKRQHVDCALLGGELDDRRDGRTVELDAEGFELRDDGLGEVADDDLRFG